MRLNQLEAGLESCRKKLDHYEKFDWVPKERTKTVERTYWVTSLFQLNKNTAKL